MVKLLTAAGGTKSPSSLPVLDNSPDPLFSQPPPWLAKSCEQIIENNKAVAEQPKEGLYGFLKKGSKLLSNTAEKKPNDNNKPSVIKTFNKKEDKDEERKMSHKPHGQNIFPALNNDSKKEVSTENMNEKIEDVELQNTISPSEIVVPEGETDNNEFIEKTETRNGFENSTKIIKTEFLSKMSRKNNESSEEQETEAKCKTESKPNKLMKTFSNTFSKGSNKNAMKGEEVKANEIPNPMTKLKRFLPSILDKQTTKKETDNGDESDKSKSLLFSKLKKMKTHKAMNHNTNTTEQKTEETTQYEDPKPQKVETNKQQLFQKLKLKNEQKTNESTKNNATIVFKVQNNVKLLCSKVTTKKEEKIEHNKETPFVKNFSDRFDNFKKKCSTSFKQDNGYGDENNEFKKVKEKEKTDFSGIKLRLSSIGKSKEEDAKKNFKIQASESHNKMDQLKNRVSSLMKRKEETQEKCETQLENQTQSEQSVKLRKEVTMNKQDMSKFQWIMLDGQWIKSQSVGL